VNEAPLNPGQERDVGAAEAVGEVVLAAWFALVIEGVEGLAFVVLDLRDLARMLAPMLDGAKMLGLALSGGAVTC